LPDPDEEGRQYIDLWDSVKGAKTKEEYISACKGAIASIYSSWKKDFNDWNSSLEFVRGPCPVLLCVADNATKASWLFDHLTREYNLLRNPEDEDRHKWVTISIDSKVFDAEKGTEAVLREMVNTVGVKDKPGEHVRCIVSVNMLSEGWDVKSVTHILGLRAFGSPLLTEQIIGRGLRRTSYDILNQPLEERTKESEETMDAFGIPFVGFPVEKRKRPKTGDWNRNPVLIEPNPKKEQYQVQIPNVRSWAVGVSKSLADIVNIASLPEIHLNPKDTPPEVPIRSVVGGSSESIMRFDEFREEWPLLRTAFQMAQELYDATNPGTASDLGLGPTFDELLEITLEYIETKVIPIRVENIESDKRDIGIYSWRRKAVDILETSIRNSAPSNIEAVPILATPEYLSTGKMRRFQWTGIIGDGKRCHTNKVPCHSDLEKKFADFLDTAPDVIKYIKNERLGFSITYYERNRPRQYYPDFIIVVNGASGREEYWIAEPKGEERSSTTLKTEAAKIWCDKMNQTRYRYWRYLFIPQRGLESALKKGVYSLQDLAIALQKYQ
jgi:type III restriction enzyme